MCIRGFSNNSSSEVSSEVSIGNISSSSGINNLEASVSQMGGNIEQMMEMLRLHTSLSGASAQVRISPIKVTLTLTLIKEVVIVIICLQMVSQPI